MERIADISRYQGDIDWNVAKNDLDFAIFRASVGLNCDSKYLNNTSMCAIPYAAYHYTKAGNAEEAVKEADFFVECANSAWQKPSIYFADIEYEAQDANTTEEVATAFLNRLRELGCDKIGLYINTRYKWAGKAIELADVMWIPHWGKNDGQIPAQEYAPKNPYDIWQYTSKGRVEGISGNVDLNILRDGLTVSELIKPKKTNGNSTFADALKGILSLIGKFFNFSKK